MVGLEQLIYGTHVSLLYFSPACSPPNCAIFSNGIPPECVVCKGNSTDALINGTCGMHINTCRAYLTIFIESLMAMIILCLYYFLVFSLNCTHTIVCKNDCKEPASGDDGGSGILIGRQDL